MAFDLRQFAKTVRVSDGAWGTQLHKQGLSPGSPPEIWNVSQPLAVETVAGAYVRAGSDVILTNTFGANRFILERHGVENRTAELAEAGVAISRKIADAATGWQVKVFASMGPTGMIVMMDEVPKEKISAAFAEAAEACSWGLADAIVLETFNELDEIRLALRACKKACDLPVVVSMTFASGPDKTTSIMGNKPSDLAAMAIKCGADAVGANCGAGPDNYVRVARMLRDACDLPIWIKANAGLPVLEPSGATSFPMGPGDFAAYVPALVEAGASFIGGCCGTTPEHIVAVRAAVDKLAKK